MAKHRRAEIDDADDGAGERRRSTSKRQHGGSWLVWLGSRLFVVALLLGVLAYFAPLLIGNMGLWKTLLATAAPDIAKQVDAK
jgi:MoxR-like ATPase